MDTQDVLLVDAFAPEPTAGTPVGVVTDGGELSDNQMQAIASELGASATAFVLDSERADRRLEMFTPTEAGGHADHAAVAAHAALFERGGIDAGEFTVETGQTVRDGEVKTDGTVWIELGQVDVRAVSLAHDDVADALGVDVASLRDVGADLPLAVADAGVPWLLVPVNYFEHLSTLDPDMAAVQRLCERVDASGLYAFTFDTINAESTLHGRAFGPEMGRGEDPATGTAAGACGAYIRREGAIDNTVEQVVVEQGHFIDRPGTVRVDTDGTESWVGGRAVTTLQGSMTVPDAEEDDEIIEL